MKRSLLCLLVLSLLFTFVACGKPHETEYHPTGFDGTMLYINVDGKTYAYERFEGGSGELTQDEMLDSFTTQTEFEGIVWHVFSVEEHRDLSYVLVISGTNSVWTYRAAAQE